MAKVDETMAVFGILEKVFNPEEVYEYDEALEELGLHTAKVRKTFPHLFKALQFPSRMLTDGHAVQPSPEIIEMLAKAIGNSNGHAVKQTVEMKLYQPPAEKIDPAGVPVPMDGGEDQEPAIAVIPYSEWATGPATRARMGEEFAFRWDIQAPPKQVTESFVLANREGGGRTRFHVIGLLDDMVFQVKVVKVMSGMDE